MENLRLPFTAVTHINTSYLQQSVNKSDKSKQIVTTKESDIHKLDEKKKSQVVQEEQIENLEKEQLMTLVRQYKNIISTCFDENDKLRERVSKLEALYSAAQDEIEIRDKAIEELAAIVQKVINILNKPILKLSTDDKEGN